MERLAETVFYLLRRFISTALCLRLIGRGIRSIVTLSTDLRTILTVSPLADHTRSASSGSQSSAHVAGKPLSLPLLGKGENEQAWGDCPELDVLLPSYSVTLLR